MLADLVGYKINPGDGVAQVTFAIQQCGDQRLRQFHTWLGIQASQQGCYAAIRPGRVNCALQVRLGQAPSLQLGPVKRTRHDQRRTSHLTQFSGRCGNGLVNKAPVRVDGNELVQRPGWRDTLAGYGYARLQLRKGERIRRYVVGWLFNNSVHL